MATLNLDGIRTSGAGLVLKSMWRAAVRQIAGTRAGCLASVEEPARQAL